MSIFTERLCQMVEKRGISWTILSDVTDLSSSRISQYKTGIYQPKTEALHRIAKALDVSPEWLIGCTDIKLPYLDKDSTCVSVFDIQFLSAYKNAPDRIKRAVRLLLDIDEDEPDWSSFSEIRGDS